MDFNDEQAKALLKISENFNVGEYTCDDISRLIDIIRDVSRNRFADPDENPDQFQKDIIVLKDIIEFGLRIPQSYLDNLGLSCKNTEQWKEWGHNFYGNMFGAFKQTSLSKAIRDIGGS